MATDNDSEDGEAPEAKAKKEAKAKPRKDAKPKKDTKAKGEKGGKKGKGRGEEAAFSSIATHPRARGAVRRAKGWAGLVGFGLAAALSLKASVPLVQVGLRALGAGLAGYMLGWWVSVLVWRHLIVAEQQAAYEELKRRRAEEANGDSKSEAQFVG